MPSCSLGMMDIQIAALCDFAVDYGGRLCIFGVFESLSFPSFPALHLQCAIVLRVSFRKEDEGNHRLLLNFVDADGQSIVPPLDTQMALELPPDGFCAARNFILNLQNLKFDKAGLYAVDISLDNRSVASIPLTVRQFDWKPASPPA